MLSQEKLQYQDVGNLVLTRWIRQYSGSSGNDVVDFPRGMAPCTTRLQFGRFEVHIVHCFVQIYTSFEMLRKVQLQSRSLHFILHRACVFKSLLTL